jgi:MFS family permease
VDKVKLRPESLTYRSYVMLVLVLAYTLNFLDRQIIGILAIPIKTELLLTDSQLGLMGGLAFALFYTLLGIPIARLADRASRTWIMTLAIGLWSLMTAACGFVHSFGQLFLARMGVGIGEAGGVAPAYSLICDYFPPKSRARALSVYSFGIPVGSAIGIVAGGYITTLMSWRMAFIAVGLPGLIIAPLLKLSVREPLRGTYDPIHAAQPAPTLRAVIATLANKPSFWLLALGSAAASMMGYGLFFWMPSFLVRSFGLKLLQASLGFGALLLVGGVFGIWFGGFVADRVGQRRKAAYALIPAVVLSGTLWLSVITLLVPTALGLAWLGPVLAALQQLVPPSMRATASALFLFINNLIGIGLGSTLIGVLSDVLRVRAGVESLRYAIFAGTGFYVVAAMFYLRSRQLRKA